MSSARVAVVGAGLSGSLACLSLAARGVRATLLDQAAASGRFGGASARSDLGAQFFRASNDQFRALLDELARQKLVARWRGAFGVLGSKGGGLLPRGAIPSNQTETPAAPARDGGDFCGFVEAGDGGDLWVARDNAAVCAAIRAMADVDVEIRRVDALKRDGGGWTVGGAETFDAVILATHDPGPAPRGQANVAAPLSDVGIPWGRVAAPRLRRGYSASRGAFLNAPSRLSRRQIEGAGAGLASRAVGELEVADAGVAARLADLKMALDAAREARAPLFSAAVTVQGDVKLDAATVPGSPIVQFLAREASKPGRGDAATWTVASTSTFADRAGDDDALDALAEETARLLAPLGAIGVEGVAAKRWGAALPGATLEAWSRTEERAVVLEPFGLGIAGDYVRGAACPVEAAALSGLEAGARVEGLVGS